MGSVCSIVALMGCHPCTLKSPCTEFTVEWKSGKAAGIVWCLWVELLQVLAALLLECVLQSAFGGSTSRPPLNSIHPWPIGRPSLQIVHRHCEVLGIPKTRYFLRTTRSNHFICFRPVRMRGRCPCMWGSCRLCRLSDCVFWFRY